jgi:hypothetical protein
MRELTLNERMDLGRDAGLLKDNPAFSFALNYLRESCHERLKTCPLKDTEALTLIAQQLKVVDAFESAMHGLVENGRLAKREWEDVQARRDGLVQRTLRRVS